MRSNSSVGFDGRNLVLFFVLFMFMLSMPTLLETNILDVLSECPVLIHLVDMASMEIWTNLQFVPKATDTF